MAKTAIAKTMMPLTIKLSPSTLTFCPVKTDKHIDLNHENFADVKMRVIYRNMLHTVYLKKPVY